MPNYELSAVSSSLPRLHDLGYPRAKPISAKEIYPSHRKTFLSTNRHVANRLSQTDFDRLSARTRQEEEDDHVNTANSQHPA